MKLNNTDNRALQVMRAAFIHRNNIDARQAQNVAFAEALDKVAG